jgi:hypothetical protein
MSGPRFAPMTSALLARKGDAAPSIIERSKPAPRWNDLAPSLAPAPRPVAFPRAAASHASPASRETHEAEHAGDHSRRIVLTLSPAEHEKLGIAAVKKGVTRNQLVRTALESFLDSLLQEYRGSCACLGADPDGTTCCSR